MKGRAGQRGAEDERDREERRTSGTKEKWGMEHNTMQNICIQSGTDLQSVRSLTHALPRILSDEFKGDQVVSLTAQIIIPSIT